MDRTSWYTVAIKYTPKTGVFYWSFEGLSTPDAHYEARIVSISGISREISAETGQFRISECVITLNNTDRLFGSIRGSYPYVIKNSLVEIYLLSATTAWDDRVTIFTGYVYDWSMTPKTMELRCRDLAWGVMSSTIRNLTAVDRINWPNTPDSVIKENLPSILGLVQASDRGANRAYLVSAASPFYYPCASNRVTIDADRVYLYGSAIVPAPTVTTIVSLGKTFDVVSFGVDMRDANRANEFEITLDCTGYYDYWVDSAGKWHPVGAGMLRAFLAMYWDFTNWNTAGWTKCYSLQAERRNLSSVQCGMSIQNPQMTGLELIEKLSASFPMFVFVNRAGEMTARALYPDIIIDESGTIDITDENDIVRDSFVVMPQNKAVSNLQHNFKYDYVRNFFEYQRDGKEWRARWEIGDWVRDNLNLWAVRGRTPEAEWAMRTRRWLMSERVHYVRFDLPLMHYDLDVGDFITLTARHSVGTYGWSQQLAMLTRMDISISPRRQLIGCEAIVFDAVEPSEIPNLRAWYDGEQEYRMGYYDGSITGMATVHDFSGNGNDLTQATGSKRPVFKQGDVASPHRIDFDGADDSAELSSIEDKILDYNYSEASIITLFRPDLTNKWQSPVCIKDSNDNVAQLGLVAMSGILTGSVDEWATYASGIYSSGVWCLAMLRHKDAEPANTRLYRDGSLLDSAITASGVDWPDGYGVLVLGGAGAKAKATDLAFNGQIAECMVFDRLLRQSEFRTIEKYIGDKYEDYSIITVPTTFYPVDIDGCILWLDGSILTGPHGTPIAQWPDSSGCKHHFLQATAGNKPTVFGPNPLFYNNQKCVLFDGSDDFLSLADDPEFEFDGTQDFHIFVVAANWLSGDCVLCKGDGAADANTEWIFSRNGADQHYYSHAAWWDLDMSYDAGVAIYSVGFWKTQLEAHKNGALTATLTRSGTYAANKTFDLYLGKQGSAGSAYFNGAIQEILIYRRRLLPSERIKVEAYLAAKWGVTVTADYSSGY